MVSITLITQLLTAHVPTVTPTAAQIQIEADRQKNVPATLEQVKDIHIKEHESPPKDPADTPTGTTKNNQDEGTTRDVPFYSQFQDISSRVWQKRGCGVASLAMLIDFYTNKQISVEKLLDDGRDAGAYISGAGWSHQGLVNLAQSHGLSGYTKGFTHLSKNKALKKLRKILADGPIIASVHYKMVPGHPIPHLAVINEINGDTVVYNDPANQHGYKRIPLTRFWNAWKQRAIVISG